MANDDLPLKLIFTRWYNSIREWILDDINQMLANTIVGGKLVGSKISGTIPSSTIPNTAVTPGTYGDSADVGQFTVESDGRLTFADNVPIQTMGASGASHQAGFVPDPGSVAGTTHYLREDGTWDIPAGTGSSTLAGDTDVSISSPAISDHLIYQTSDSKWHNHAEFFNILADGADPTGVSDSSSAFQTRINAILGGSVTGYIIVPPGTYKFTSSVAATNVSANVGVRILAYGATFKLANSVTCFHAVSGSGWQLFSIDGAIFDGNGTTGTSGVVFENIQSGARVANCWFNKLATYGIRVLNSGSAGNFTENVTIQNVAMFQCGTGIAFTKTGGDPSQEEPFLANIELSECTTAILIDNGVSLKRSRFKAVNIWRQQGQVGININNGSVDDSVWECHFEGVGTVTDANNVVVGSSATNTDQLDAHFGFSLMSTIPGITNSSNLALRWRTGNVVYTWGSGVGLQHADETDTDPRVQSLTTFAGGGGFKFGPGGSTAPDVDIFRKAANVLATDDVFLIGSFAAAGLPSAATAGAGALAWVTDAGGGAQFQKSNGASWSNLIPASATMRWEPLVNDSASSPVDFIYTNGDVIVAAD